MSRKFVLQGAVRPQTAPLGLEVLLHTRIKRFSMILESPIQSKIKAYQEQIVSWAYR